MKETTQVDIFCDSSLCEHLVWISLTFYLFIIFLTLVYI